MSTSAPIAELCPSCGAAAPEGARFCPSCGAELGAGSTVRAQVPLEETQISYRRAEPRWFGVAPPQLLLGLSLVTVIIAIVLFATGHWPYGLILLGIGALLLAAFLEAARRRPAHPLVRTSLHARERARAAAETWRARSVAAAQVKQVRRSLLLLEADRRALLHDLGGAVHRRDEPAEAAIRERLTGLDAHEAELHAHLDRVLGEAGERIRQARLPVEETMLVVPPEPGPDPDGT